MLKNFIYYFMPKKTKKQKIIAEYRKRLKLLQTQNAPAVSYQELNSQKKQPDPDLAKINKSVQNTKPKLQPIKLNQFNSVALPKLDKEQVKYDSMFSHHTKQDLKKTIFLTLIIFVLEFFVFYVSLKGIIKI